MFTWLNKQGVQSDQGFVVQRTDRLAAEYREHGRVITVYIQSGLSEGKRCLIIQGTAFERWDGDPENKRISLDDQLRMLRNFREALEFQGTALVVR